MSAMMHLGVEEFCANLTDVLAGWDLAHPTWRSSSRGGVDRAVSFLLVGRALGATSGIELSTDVEVALADSLSDGLWPLTGDVGAIDLAAREQITLAAATEKLEAGDFGLCVPAAVVGNPSTAHEETQLPSNETMRLQRDLRYCRYAVTQLSASMYHGDDGQSRVLLDTVRWSWNPRFSWHVDLWRTVTEGLDRYRYTHPDFEQRAEAIAHKTVFMLHRVGITSRPKLCL